MTEATSNKAVGLGKVSATGGLHLFTGRLISSLIMAIGTLILGALILDTDYGLYTVALVPSATFLLFSDWGVGSAIIRYCAQCRAAKNETDLRKTIVASLVFAAGTGLSLTILSILMANFIASTLFNKPEATVPIMLISITILTNSMFSITSSIFAGFENMKLISIAMTFQALAYSVTAPLLVFLGYGVYGVIGGSVLASITVSLTSLLLLYFVIFRRLVKIKITRNDILPALKPLLKFGIPLAIGTILNGLLAQFNSFMMASFIKDLSLIGNYKIATNFTILLSFFTVPLSTVLFPAFSKVNVNDEPLLVRTLYSSSIKYASLILVPATMIMIVLSPSIIGTLYGAKWPYAASFLSLAVLINLLTLFGWLSFTGLVTSMGETKLVMKIALINLLVGIPLNVALVPIFGISGVILSSLFSILPSFVISSFIMWRKYGVKPDFGNSFRILLASIFAALTVFGLLNAFTLSYWIQLAVGVSLFLIIYLISVPLIGAVNQADVRNLKVMFSGFGVISKILNIPLYIMEKFLKR